MIAATEQPSSQLCAACFTGKYPIELPPDDQLGKHLLEQAELPLGPPEDGLKQLAVALMKIANDVRCEQGRLHRARAPVTTPLTSNTASPAPTTLMEHL